jgi:hypothetical protein
MDCEPGDEGVQRQHVLEQNGLADFAPEPAAGGLPLARCRPLPGGEQTAARVRQKEMIMKTNEGLADRAVRLIAGTAILSLLTVGTVPGWGLIGLIGLVPVVTGLVGYCPTYTLLGIDTRGGFFRRQTEGG